MNEDKRAGVAVLADDALEEVQGGFGLADVVRASARLDGVQRLQQVARQARQQERVRQLLEAGLAPIGLGCPRGHQRDSQRGKKGATLRAQLQKDQQLLSSVLSAR